MTDDENSLYIAGNLIFVNAPSFAGSIWTIIKKFLDPKTASKISILVGPSREYLREVCGEAVLPIEFGGTNSYVLPHPVQKVDAIFDRDYALEEES